MKEEKPIKLRYNDNIKVSSRQNLQFGVKWYWRYELCSWASKTIETELIVGMIIILYTKVYKKYNMNA